MVTHEMNILVASDFNSEGLVRYLNYDADSPMVKVVGGQFGSAQVLLFTPGNIDDLNSYDAVVVWTLPELSIPTYKAATEYYNVDIEKALDEVDLYCDAVAKVHTHIKTIVVPTWIMPPKQRGYGLMDLVPGVGVKYLLMRMNQRLAENLSSLGGVYVLDTERWMARSGFNGVDLKLWFVGKIYFRPEVFKAAVKDIKAALRAIRGPSKKIILVDLDETLWGGIVGDDGWENLRLGGHDAIGESYVEFQLGLKSLMNRGILLGIISKNEEQIALEAINKHPEMVLRQNDFVGWRINWEDKAKNIQLLLAELRLGLDSAVFIDDSVYEREQVKATLPGVFVPSWPLDKTRYVEALQQLTSFDTPIATTEDKIRLETYQNEKERQSLYQGLGSMDEWLENLDLIVTVERLKPQNMPRAIQLLNKTNQVNLRARRLTQVEYECWIEVATRSAWTITVCDRFGNLGLVGLLSVETEGVTADVVDFVLSCRAMGRKVEEVMIYCLTEHARSMHLKQLTMNFVRTTRNAPLDKILRATAMIHDSENEIYYWNIEHSYNLPKHIKCDFGDD
jgi:FkbH-like protein